MAGFKKGALRRAFLFFLAISNLNVYIQVMQPRSDAIDNTEQTVQNGTSARNCQNHASRRVRG
jgi:hypothetical protein